MNKNKNLGFTLAEVLIVIGIIGVVAALTLPNLNHATGDKEKVTKVKKIYSSLTEAVDRAQVIYGNCDTWFKDLGEEEYDKKAERAAKRITEFLKVSKDCGFGDGCFSSGALLNWYNDEWDENFLNLLKNNKKAYMVMLSDGMSLAFHKVNDDYFKITVDVDGPNKGKNQWGNDIHEFVVILDNYDMPKNQLLYDAINSGQFEGTNLSYPTAWVIENGNLDYLKATGNDEGEFECPNGTILNWETNTSCE